MSHPSPIHEPIVYLGGCQSSFGREQLSSRGSIFKVDNFVRFMVETFARVGDRSTRSDISGRINLNTLYRKGDHITWGDRLFRETGIKKFIVSSSNNIIYIQVHHFTQKTILNQSLYHMIHYLEPNTKSMGGSNHHPLW